MSSEALYRSFNLAKQRFQLEACFAAPSYDPKVEQVFQEINQLFATPDIQQRLQEKRGAI